MQKSWRKTTKIDDGAKSQREKREKLENVWIVTLKKSYYAFLKTWYTSFDRSKISLDRSKQTEAPSLKNFKILKISIGRKTEWTDRIRQRLTKFFRKNTIFEKQIDLTQSIEIQEQKCMSMRWYDFPNKNFKPDIPKNKILHSPQIFKQQI